MIGISVLVGLTAALAMAFSGADLLTAFLQGYVGGGVASMIVLATALSLRDRLSRRAEERRDRLAAGGAQHNPEGPYNQ
ncbi:hypothetical protein [Paracoccus liaowanqingii]|nr:hypothetical protein [Paracoccus liaowanqingii]